MAISISIDRVPLGQGEMFGEKATRLMQMRQLSLPVPYAEVISSREVHQHLLSERIDRVSLRRDAEAMLRRIEETPEIAAQGLRFGDPEHPLLLSVRSGAAQKMAGLLATLLRVGMDRSMIGSLSNVSGDPLGAHREYLRYLLDYNALVAGVSREKLLAIGEPSSELSGLWAQIDAAADLHQEFTGSPFPADPMEQLVSALVAVAGSWRSESAQRYRDYRNIPAEPVSPVIVQRFVSGGLGPLSFSGLVQTRDPMTGEPGLIGQFRRGAGDLVMSGTPSRARRLDRLALTARPIAQQLKATGDILERAFLGPQAFEFTVERGAFHVLQSGDLVGSPLAMLRSGLALYEAGTIDTRRLRSLVGSRNFEALRRPTYGEPVDGKTLLDQTLFMGTSVVAGIGAGPASVLDFRHSLPDLSGTDNKVLFILGAPPSELWGDLLRNAAAMIFVDTPPAHFVQRAAEKSLRVRGGLPVVTHPDAVVELDPEGMLRIRGEEQTRLLRKGEIVSVDGSRPDGLVAAGRLREERREYDPLAQYLAETAGDRDEEEVARLRGAIRGRRAGEQAEAIIHYDAAMRRLAVEESEQGVEEVASELLAIPEPEWPAVKDVILRRRWGVEGWSHGEEQNTYRFDSRVGELLAHWLEVAGDQLARTFLRTTMTEHSFAVGLFRTIPPERRALFLNTYVRQAEAQGIPPGRRAGIFLMSRMISSFWENPEEGGALIGALEPSARRFFEDELDILYAALNKPKDMGELRELAGIMDRFPGLSRSRMQEILSRAPVKS